MNLFASRRVNLRGLLVGLAIGWVGCSHGTVRPPSSNDRTLAERVRAFQARLAREGPKAWPGFKLVPGTFVVIDEHQAECFGADCPAPFRGGRGVTSKPFGFESFSQDPEAWDWASVPPAPAERGEFERATTLSTYATGARPFELAMAEDAFSGFISSWPAEGERVIGLFFLGPRQRSLSEPQLLDDARSEEKILSDILFRSAPDRLPLYAEWVKISKRLAILEGGEEEEHLSTYLGLERYVAAAVIKGKQRAIQSIAAELNAGMADLWPEYWLLYQRPWVVGGALAFVLDGLERGWKQAFATDHLSLAERVRVGIKWHEAAVRSQESQERSRPRWGKSFSPNAEGGPECEHSVGPGSAVVLVAAQHGDHYFVEPLRATSDPNPAARRLGDAFVFGHGNSVRLSGRVQADVATREACLHLDGKRAIEAVARALASVPPNQPSALRFETPQLGIDSPRARVTPLPHGRGWRVDFPQSTQGEVGAAPATPARTPSCPG